MVREIAAALDPKLSINEPRLMADFVFAANAQPRLNSTLLATFAGIAVLLAGIGIYSVTAYSIAQRRHEIAIRMALGAPKSAIFRLISGEGLRLVGISIMGGSACSMLAWPLLRKVAYGSAGGDAVALLWIAVLLIAIAFVACATPALRACRADPLAALGQP